jgi:predicted small secreted protein
MKSRTAFVAAALLLLLAVASVLTGCNTWAGAGKDVERGGELMQGK